MDGNSNNNNNNHGSSNDNLFSGGQNNGNQTQYMGNTQYTNPGQYNNNQFNNQYNQGYQNYNNVPRSDGASSSGTASLVLGILGLLSGGGLFSIIGLFLASSAKKKGDTSGVRKAGFITSLIGLIFFILIIVLVVISIGLGMMVPATIAYTAKSQDANAKQTATSVQTAVSVAVLEPEAIHADDYADAMVMLDNGVYMSDMSKGENTVYDLIFESLDISDSSEIIDKVKNVGGTDIYIDYDVMDNTCVVDIVGTDISVGDDD
jgi:hypothetical protein